MQRKGIFFKVVFATFLILELFSLSTYAEEDISSVSAVYITGIGCGNCAVTDPKLFIDATSANPDLVIFEYEIYRSAKENQEIKNAYFHTFIPKGRSGVPFLVLNKDETYIGRFDVLKATEKLLEIFSNDFPLPNGAMLRFDELNIATLPGKINIWTKNRILISGENGDNEILKRVIVEDDLSRALQGVYFEEIDPQPVPVSRAEINFEHAVKVGDWILQWNGKPLNTKIINGDEYQSDVGHKQVTRVSKNYMSLSGDAMFWILVIVVFLVFLLASLKISINKKGISIVFRQKEKSRDFVVVFVAMIALIVFFLVAKNVSPDILKEAGYSMPLPIFTFFIALVDGFNPCNMFVLTCLLVLLISTSDDKKRLYAVALSFVVMVYIIYFLFMAAWLNVFKYIGFIAPLRIGIALIALVAGIINCKDFLFFKKGVSLTIQEQHKGPLLRRIRGMKDIVKNGSYPLLIVSSIGLAAFASLVELPCTAGFPIIYTSVLSAKYIESGFGYYGYLALYNLVYVLPLLVIVSIFIYTFKARYITQRQIEILKLIGGIIMILLGIVLLVNPGLIGLGIG